MAINKINKSRFRTWFNNLSIEDPIQFQMGLLLQGLLLGFIALLFLTVIANLFLAPPSFSRLETIIRGIVISSIFSIPLFLLRRGYFRHATILLICLFLGLMTAGVLSSSLQGVSNTLSFFTLIIILAGLLVSRKALISTFLFSTGLLFFAALQEQDPALRNENIVILGNFILINGLISVFINSFGVTLRTALNSALEREIELNKEIANHKQTAEKIRQSSNQLAITNEIGHAITELRDLESVLEIILQQVMQVIPLDALFITLYDPESQSISFPLFYEGGKRWHEPNSTLKPGSNISRVIQTGESILRLVTAEELEQSQKHPQVLLGDRSQVSASFMYVPLLIKGKVIGIISAQSYALNVYTETNLRLLEGVALQAAIAIENARLYANLQNELTERLRIEAERKRLIEQLEANNAELERFTYTVSHDLRNPLVTIKGFLGMLDKDLRENRPDRVQTDFQRIAGATDKMDALLTDLLELSRIGRIVNPPMEVDTVRLIQDALDNLNGRLRPKNITMQIASEFPSLYGDRTRLREVFENLIENAVKYIGNQANPLIEIGTRQEKNGQVIFIKDNGMGIEERYHTRIFTLFEKLNPNIDGTGIGLAIVKRIIETHGGRVWVESEGLGRGSTFCFTIPDGR